MTKKEEYKVLLQQFFRNKKDSERREGVHFSKAVLIHSNATPFNVIRQNAVVCCFRCPNDLDMLPLNLKQHVEQTHAKTIAGILKSKPKTTLRIDITDLTCKQCGDPCSDLAAFEHHIQSAHDIHLYKDTSNVLIPYRLGKMLECQMCRQSAQNMKALDEHMENAHFSLEMCEICGKGFMNEDRLKKHKALDHEEKRHACEYCGAKFYKGAFLTQHIENTHKRIGSFKCTKCPNVSFFNYYKLMKHKSEMHGGKMPSYACETCGKTFISKNFLRIHVQRLHTIPEFKCDLCDEAFVTAMKLRSHKLRVHEGVRVPCVYCGKDYTCAGNLAKHYKKVHRGLEIRCPCLCCGKPCGNRYNLVQHAKTEHGTELYTHNH